MADNNLTIIEEITPVEDIIDEEIDAEELDVGEMMLIETGGVELNSLDFVPTSGEFVYADNTAKFPGEFKYSTVKKPDEILTASGSISFGIHGYDGIVVDADENNSLIEVHLDGDIIKSLEDFNIDISTLKVNYQKLNDLVKSIPFAKSFTNIEALVTALNGATADEMNVGSNLFIQTLNVPDFWIYSRETTSVPYTYTTDEDLINAIKTNGSQQIGYYKISPLETDKVDLSNYYTKTESDAITDELQRDILKVDGILAETNYELNQAIADIENLEMGNKDLNDYVTDLQTRVGDMEEFGLTTNTPQIIKKEGAKIFESGFGISSSNGADVIKVTNYGNALSLLDANGDSMFYLDKTKQSASAFGKELMTKDDFVAQHGTKVTAGGVFQETWNADTKADKTEIQNFVEKTKTQENNTTKINNTGRTISASVLDLDGGSVLGLSSNSAQLSISENNKESSILMTPDNINIDSTNLTHNGEDIVTKPQLDAKQDELTAGTNITIDDNNVISATGGPNLKYSEFINNEDLLGNCDAWVPKNPEQDGLAMANIKFDSDGNPTSLRLIGILDSDVAITAQVTREDNTTAYGNILMSQGNNKDTIEISASTDAAHSNHTLLSISPESVTINGEKIVTESDIPNDYVTIDTTQTINADKTIVGNLTVQGNITQNGSDYITHAEKIYTNNDYIIMREGATGGLGSGYSGFEVIKYNGTDNGRLAIGADGVARVGDVGDEQPLATREETPLNNGFAKWDDTNKKFVTTTISSNDLTDKASLATATDLNALTARVGTNETNITNLQTQVSENADDIATNMADIASLQTSKQNTLTAGENITITNNIISADIPEGASTYDLVITNQNEFDAFFNSSNSSVKTIAILSGTYSKNFVTIPTNVKLITGFGDVKITTAEMNGNKSTIANISLEFRNFSSSIGESESGFYNFLNVYNCSVIMRTCIGSRFAFTDCDNVINCKAILWTSTLDTEAQLIGFDHCDNLVNCYSEIIDLSSGSREYSITFTACNNLVNCYGQNRRNNNYISVYENCTFLNNCSYYQETENPFKGCTYIGAYSSDLAQYMKKVDTSLPTATTEEDYALVQNSDGTIKKRAMNQVLDDIGGSTILNDGVRQSTFDVKTLQDEIPTNTSQLTNDSNFTTLNAVYPVGSIYLSTNSTSPANLFGGSWEQLPEGYALWTASSGAGGTIAAGLPNITGSFIGGTWQEESRGAFYDDVNNTRAANGMDNRYRVGFDASRSSTIYGNSDTVQPPAYKIYAWKRIS